MTTYSISGQAAPPQDYPPPGWNPRTDYHDEVPAPARQSMTAQAWEMLRERLMLTASYGLPMRADDARAVIEEIDVLRSSESNLVIVARRCLDRVSAHRYMVAELAAANKELRARLARLDAGEGQAQ